MPILPLNQLSALSAGADLWICPDLDHSKWTHEIDWSINHQIRKSEHHKMQVLGPEIKGLLYENQMALLDVPASSQDLMIATHMQLPNRWILITAWNGQLTKWCGHVVKQWERLQYPSLRLFLPHGVTTSEIARELQKLTDHQDLTVVLDKE